uniref:Stress-associated endoplasmic reticulum protein n=1 Tax=Anas zonorhyncha TaxID=75864 RepID=A0A8B9W1E9_9AVES
MVAKQRIRMANEKHSKNITQRGNVAKTSVRGAGTGRGRGTGTGLGDGVNPAFSSVSSNDGSTAKLLPYGWSQFLLSNVEIPSETLPACIEECNLKSQ